MFPIYIHHNFRARSFLLKYFSLANEPIFYFGYFMSV